MVRAEGEFFRRLARRPTAMHVVVAWLIFLPPLIVFPVSLALHKVGHPFLVALIIALLVVWLLVPVTVTKRYFARREPK